MSKEPSIGVRMIVLGAIVLGIVAALGAGAAQEKSAVLKVAVVDVAKVGDGYNGTQKFNTEMKKHIDDLRLQLKTWQDNPLLSKSEQARMADLTIRKDGLTDPEKADLKRLTDESNALNDEGKTLQNTPQPNPAQKQRITDLIKLTADTRQRLEAKTNSDQQELQHEQEQHAQSVLRDIRDAVSKVAKKEGYNVVFTSEMAWYSDNDITDAVLKQANSTSK